MSGGGERPPGSSRGSDPPPLSAGTDTGDVLGNGGFPESPLAIGDEDGDADGDAAGGGVGEASGASTAGAELTMRETGVSSSETVLCRGVGRRPVVFAIGVRIGSTTVCAVVRSGPAVRATVEPTGLETSTTLEVAGLVAALAADVAADTVVVIAPLTGVPEVVGTSGFGEGSAVAATPGTAVLAVLMGALEGPAIILPGRAGDGRAAFKAATSGTVGTRAEGEGRTAGAAGSEPAASARPLDATSATATMNAAKPTR